MIIDDILQTFKNAGGGQYGDEAVTQLGHALQCAMLAQQSGAADSLVAAALLHDIGHLVGAGDLTAAAKGIDKRHEDIGSDHLAPWFPPAVTEPIRLHVAAKRYLCATDARYYDGLSDGSRTSLAVQGGPFTETEAAEFIAMPHAPGAVDLRRWDDRAKVRDLPTPDLESYRAVLEANVVA
jgi:phosphonate degradation associated HDIG domain protein